MFDVDYKLQVPGATSPTLPSLIPMHVFALEVVSLFPLGPWLLSLKHLPLLFKFLSCASSPSQLVY